ncbi:MAG: hypothetical protein BGO29_03750 [Bacteroidales bacterium 36-12]|nr:MAG: hypothetical protein BGO29_03750 [Bacteroidales bacterium 36-12]
METVFNPQEVGKGIADFGFLIVAGATYLVYSATLFFFFIKWFVRIVNNIIEKQQRVLDELLQLQKEQKEILERIVTKLKNVA